MKNYLVTLEGPKFDRLPFAIKYKVFADGDKALKWAKENGFNTMLMPDKVEDLVIGMRQTYGVRVDNISIMAIKVIE